VSGQEAGRRRPPAGRDAAGAGGARGGEGPAATEAVAATSSTVTGSTGRRPGPRPQGRARRAASTGNKDIVSECYATATGDAMEPIDIPPGDGSAMFDLNLFIIASHFRATLDR
jgi:hypothetical protein